MVKGAKQSEKGQMVEVGEMDLGVDEKKTLLTFQRICYKDESPTV